MIYNNLLRADLVEEWRLLGTTAALLLAASYLLGFLKPSPLSKLPVLGAGQQEFVSRGWQAYLEGYQKFRDGIFRMRTSRKSPSVVISPKFLNELKALPEEVLSFGRAVDEFMQSKFTGVDGDVPSLPHTVKTALTPALHRLNPIIADEVQEAMRLELPQTSEWTEVNIHDKLLRIVAMASGRIFVGSGLCRDEAYLDAAINYTLDLMAAVRVIHDVPVWIRPFVASSLPQVKKLQTRIQEADNFLRPVVAARRSAGENPDYQQPDDMLQWLMDAQKKFGAKDDRALAKDQLGISFAAIHTTTMTTTNAFYTLAAQPDLVPLLRDDIQQALSKTKGEFSTAALQDMKKLDSFIKEVSRFYPLTAATFQRKSLKDFTLSNGQTIPAGTFIEVSSGGVCFDEEIHGNPNEFDALRYYRLRQAKDSLGSGTKAAEAVANSQFVSVSASSLGFGYGRHACPGRFFAANEVKMILATTLLNYEVMNPGGGVRRYENIYMGSTSVPDPTKTVLMRKL